MCRLYCPPLQQAAAARGRLLLFLLLFLHPPSPPCSCALLCDFKWRGASWVLQCLSRACLVTSSGGGGRLQYPQCPEATSKVSDYKTLEGMEREEEHLLSKQETVQLPSMHWGLTRPAGRLQVTRCRVSPPGAEGEEAGGGEGERQRGRHQRQGERERRTRGGRRGRR